MFFKRVFNAFLLTGLLLAAFGAPVGASAAPPNGVDHLRGRWEGTLLNLQGSNQPFTLLLDEFGPDPDEPQALFYSGCIAVGQQADFAPVSARVLIAGNEQFDLTLFGTAAPNGGAFVIKLTGQASTFAAKVKDDSASGAWLTAGEAGDWSAIHHDRRNPQCPAVQLDETLFFNPTVYAGVGVVSDEERGESGILEGYTNIVSSGMMVNLPDGNTVVAPFFTDLFSPTVDFVSEFRFLEGFPGLPQAGGIYTFTLLDIFGQPISGTTRTDVWFACTMGPPQNVSASVDASGITVTWDAVTPAPGFDPAGLPPLGFYQIELSGGYGANGILTSSHLIPQTDFGASAPGSPDGYDNGLALEQMPDGIYTFDIIAFSEAVPGSGGVGLECQIRDQRETVTLEKAGSTITILP